jgi:hypothetical protein
MKLVIKDSLEKEVEVLEIWLEKAGENVFVVSKLGSSDEKREFKISPNGRWVKLNFGNLKSVIMGKE